MRRIPSDLIYGTALAAAAAGLSCLLALAGFGRSYYLSVFLPLFMLAYLLVAWILHLRDDRFMRSPSAVRREPGESSASTHPGAKRALLWAAAELAVAATLLYSLWGIGAVYHG